MKIAVIGGNGQLGNDVVKAFRANGDEVSSLSHADIELSDLASVTAALSKINPNVIVNTAAMHHVENCETDPAKAFAINGIGSRNLAIASRDNNATLMHVSTDYVFDGNKNQPYIEDDAPRPLNAYGITKLAGEHFVISTAPKHFVIRTSGLYGKNPCRAKGGLNFIELMLKLAKERGKVRVVDSEIVSPTSTAELAEQIVQLSHSDAYGLYHATAEGSCSWHAFAREIFAVTETPVQLEIAGPNEFPAKVARPKYSVLENDALKRQGLNVFKPWQEALHEYLGDRVKSPSVQTLS